jgi:hypothetical protein
MKGEIKMRKSLEDIKHMVKNIPYPGYLPEELKSFHYYISDSGHCIMCVLRCHLEEAEGDMYMYEVPVPIKYVLEKGYEIVGEHVIVDAEYDEDLGLIVDDKYFEF